jgi:cellulose synthase/poly-beta-1,6-N-acetylglucosamine synthase-like glycosyltransferase
MDQFLNFLSKKKLLTADELATVSAEREKSGSDLPEIIFSQGYINPYKLYSALAEFSNLEFADLGKYPCDKNLLDEKDREAYQQLRSIPWKTDGDKTVIATSSITQAVENWAASRYENYCFAITSPFDIHSSINNIFINENNLDAREKLMRMHPDFSANNLFAGVQSKIFLSILALIFPCFILFPEIAWTTLFVVVAYFYTATLAFKFLFFLIGIVHARRASSEQKIVQLPDSRLPVYTILIPLYKEARTLKKLTDAIRALDYPKSRLDVKLIVEADDEMTIAAIKALKCERMFEMVQVPYSIPRTKPKACNYALRFAKGEFVTIYDAEDIPDPLQLKKALYVFYNSSEDVACVQAKLSYFNREENLLSRMFTIEYSILFDFTLFGLEAMGIPIPLGGTSNHFRVKTLNALYAWDPYNVTEDADLGLRIAQKGWQCRVIDSVTMEECPIALNAWIKQRSRWIKGHMQTYFVHMRKPMELYKKVGAVGFFGIQFFVGAPILVFLMSPFIWILCAMLVMHIVQLPQGLPDWFGAVMRFNYYLLFIGMAFHIFYAGMAVITNKWKGMLAYSLIFPFYWVLHSVAAFRALWQLITRPHYWEKTQHGVTRVKSGT